MISAETRLHYVERILRRTMNRPDLPLNSTTRLLPQNDPHPEGLNLDEKQLTRYALDNRMDLIQIELDLAINALDVESARNALLPDVGLSVEYSLDNTGDAWSDSYHRLGQKGYESQWIGLSATIPLGNRAAEARLRKAKLARLQRQARQDELAQFIAQDVQDALSDLEGNWRRILAAEQGAISAERDYGVELSQFKIGRSNSTQVLYAAERLGDAELSRINAYVDYEIAQINLAQATGTLLGLGCVQIEPVQLSLDTP